MKSKGASNKCDAHIERWNKGTQTEFCKLQCFLNNCEQCHKVSTIGQQGQPIMCFTYLFLFKLKHLRCSSRDRLSGIWHIKLSSKMQSTRCKQWPVPEEHNMETDTCKWAMVHNLIHTASFAKSPICSNQRYTQQTPKAQFFTDITLSAFARHRQYSRTQWARLA